VVYSHYVGARVRRKEDPRLITGSSTYVGDVKLPGMLHCAILRSPYAHARINGIDASAALAHPGVVAVFTGEQMTKMAGPMVGGGGEGGDVVDDVQEGEAEKQSGQTDKEVQYPLAVGKVRHVGEQVAAVVATDMYTARDAVDMIEVDWEPLPVAATLEAAMAPDAPQLYGDKPGNIGLHWEKASGDVDAAFAEAEKDGIVLDLHIVSQRLAAVPMEGRAVCAAWDAWQNTLTVWSSNQNPHSVRSTIASVIGMAESDVRVIAPEVGGGFGVKIGAYPEDVIISAIARELKRPVKWIESRAENMLATNHGRDQNIQVQVAARKDGTVLGLKEKITSNIGAYPLAAGLAVLTAQMAIGTYKIPNITVDVTCVHTNTMSVAAYRGAGRPEACYYIERIMDSVADATGVDPVEVRRKNFIPPDAFPYKTPTGLTYDSGEYERSLDKLLEISDYKGLRAEQAKLRQQGRYMGIGVASYIEMCGFGPYESASVRVEPSGAVTVMTGISPHGQGQETTFSQIVADRLGVDFDKIAVRHGDTGNTPIGQGTMGSRGLVTGGSALVMALDKVEAKARRIAAHMLEAAPEDIEISGGRFSVKGAADRAKTLAEVAAVAYSDKLPNDINPGLEENDFFKPPGLTYPSGAHMAVVEIDPDTGDVTLQRYFTVDDCGRVVSPLLVTGQVHGGLAQGIGQALWEEVLYDEQGQLISGSLMDYTVPVAGFFPQFQTDRTETPSPLNPLGVKGIGEAATVASTPTIANAVMDALEPFGIQHLDLPLTAEKIWHAMNESQSAAAD
jgi:aerobic carbon-monoxide dehydrogenase large subunit